MSINPIDDLNWSNLDCETFKAAAIAAAKEVELKSDERHHKMMCEMVNAAYEQLKKEFPLLKIGPAGLCLELCGELFEVSLTSGFDPISGETVSSYWLRAYNGKEIRDVVSYGEYLRDKAVIQERFKSRSWLDKLFGYY